jgi:hypothetical protein
MADSNTSLGLPPSGPWSGYYLYGLEGPKHHMKLGLMFAPNGHILGEGIDDIAPFTIRGSFDSATNTAGWTKSYIGAHSVEYRGFYDGRTICGNWTLAIVSGSFWIWPRVIEAGETLHEEVEAPLEVG